jgi:hypothetical protein
VVALGCDWANWRSKCSIRAPAPSGQQSENTRSFGLLSVRRDPDAFVTVSAYSINSGAQACAAGSQATLSPTPCTGPCPGTNGSNGSNGSNGILGVSRDKNPYWESYQCRHSGYRRFASPSLGSSKLLSSWHDQRSYRLRQSVQRRRSK